MFQYNLSTTEMAKKLGFTEQTLTRWEREGYPDSSRKGVFLRLEGAIRIGGKTRWNEEKFAKFINWVNLKRWEQSEEHSKQKKEIYSSLIIGTTNSTIKGNDTLNQLVQAINS
jgi:DNA-binding transcriptional regulator YiaG